MRPWLNQVIETVARTTCVAHISVSSQGVVWPDVTIPHATLDQPLYCIQSGAVRQAVGKVSRNANTCVEIEPLFMDICLFVYVLVYLFICLCKQGHVLLISTHRFQHCYNLECEHRLCPSHDLRRRSHPLPPRNCSQYPTILCFIKQTQK